MNRRHIAVLMLACGGALAMTSLGGPDDAAKADAKPADSKACADGDKAKCCAETAQCPLLEPLRKLAGSWDVDFDGDGKPDGSVKYRVISNGTAVVEEEMPGTDHEMITVFTTDGKNVLATHYCSMGNQPRMRAEGGMKDGTMHFEFVDGGNISDRNQSHMDSLVLTFIDDAHVTAKWSVYADGKASEHVAFDMKRAKEDKVTAAK